MKESCVLIMKEKKASFGKWSVDVGVVSFF